MVVCETWPKVISLHRSRIWPPLALIVWVWAPFSWVAVSLAYPSSSGHWLSVHPRTTGVSLIRNLWSIRSPSIRAGVVLCSQYASWYYSVLQLYTVSHRPIPCNRSAPPSAGYRLE